MRGLGTIYRRGDVWWISYYHKGRKVRESARPTDRRAAERFLKHRMEERGAEALGLKRFAGPAQDRILVGELLDVLERDYALRGKTAPAYHLRPVRAAFADARAARLVEADVDRYVEERLALGYAPATVNKETHFLGQAIRRAVAEGRLSSAPRIRRLPERKVRQGFFERGDFEAVVGGLPAYLRDFSRFAYLSGWRKGEVASLLWADVDRTGRTIRLRPERSKNREGRVLALEDELWEIIERRAAERAVGDRIVPYVFHRGGEPILRFDGRGSEPARRRACRGASSTTSAERRSETWSGRASPSASRWT